MAEPIGDPTGLPALVFRSDRDWLHRLLMSQFRCGLSLHGIIQSRFRVLFAGFVSPLTAMFRRGPMAFGSLLVFLCGRSVRLNHMRVFVH